MMSKKEKYKKYVVDTMLKNSRYHKFNPSNIVMLYGGAVNKNHIFPEMVQRGLIERFGVGKEEYMGIISLYLEQLPPKE
tara:strand:- start:161 stop:397 length:237 start_codon:yes stop_codon:yes gene_type:complete